MPGNHFMTQGTLGQVLRAARLEEDSHNMNGAYEARRWSEIGKAALMISQSTVIGMGSFGFVKRVIQAEGPISD